MSFPGDDPTIRVGDAERQAAITALGEHWKAGRLDPAEHERRTTAAYAATTVGDLDAQFADLPGSWRGTATPGSAVVQPTAVTTPAEQSRGGSSLISTESWVGRRRDAIMGLTPFAALALFFLTKSWLWFLLIPALGVLLYAGENESDKQRRKRERREERERRRLEGE